MDTVETTRQSRMLLQIGVALLLFTSVEGFVIPYLPFPRLGLSVHTLSALEAVVLLIFGLIWPKLNLGAAMSQLAWWSFVYSAFATLTAYVLAAIWGAGNSTIPLAAGPAHGSSVQELVIKVVLYSAAPTDLVGLTLIFWGLRGAGRTEHR